MDSNKKKPTVCQHNIACWCTTKKCNCCGWNPTVAKKRMNKILKTQSEV